MNTKTTLKITLLAIAAVVLAAAARAGGPLGIDDLPKIYDTYASNEAKFNSIYAGEFFEAASTFHSASTSWLSGKTLHVRLGEGAFLGDVKCDVSGDAGIAMIAKLDKGDIVSVRGTIKDSTMGTIGLVNCDIFRR